MPKEVGEPQVLLERAVGERVVGLGDVRVARLEHVEVGVATAGGKLESRAGVGLGRSHRRGLEGF